MSVELTLLVWSALLCIAYIGAQSTLFRVDTGIDYARTARDEEDEKPRSVRTKRAERAMRNFLETYAVFIALAAATELAGRADMLTQWGAIAWFAGRALYLPLYILGVENWRSGVWFISACGLAAMFIGVAF